MKIKRQAVIFGIKTYRLTKQEKIFFRKSKPWGIILFSRNIKNIIQLKNLINEIKKIFNDSNYPILIDQEGGRVSRLDNIIKLNFFSQEFFGNLYKKNKKLFYLSYKIYIDKVCDIFKKVGININTVPLLDVKRSYSSNIIGDRSFSNDPNIISKIGKICIDLYRKNRIATVIKHIPGHGMAKCDSHYKTPIVSINKKMLQKKDFKPFKLCKSQFAMTAHVVYSKYDQKNTATHSKIIIRKVIRDYIKFKGILISDDISMKSLKNDLVNNAMLALGAGCNLVLHCNGRMLEMKKLAKVIPKIDNFLQKKTSHFYKFLR
tara:strand:- start:2554 stop:3507 length:954 start_codon:yes stop_codon:yes gene_type:complete